jgi:iron complex outermembrane receptor protein
MVLQMDWRSYAVFIAMVICVVTSRAEESSETEASTEDDMFEVLGDFELEDLVNTTAGRKEVSVFESAAAVSVISNEDIRRSGVRNIPEALRLAPGVHVGKLDANKWAVSIRGFNDRFANKLLVLMDGRSV